MKKFRLQLLKGYVHDPGAAMFGGVAGNAGLFSDAYDLACLMQMLLDSGMFNGKRYLQKTVSLFTAYHSNISRRGYGFDKPEKITTNVQNPTLAYPPLQPHSGILALPEHAPGPILKKNLYLFFSATG